jgi:hypothetical protein
MQFHCYHFHRELYALVRLILLRFSIDNCFKVLKRNFPRMCR